MLSSLNKLYIVSIVIFLTSSFLIASNYFFETESIEKRELNRLRISLSIVSNSISEYVDNQDKESYSKVLNIDNSTNLLNIEMTDRFGKILYEKRYTIIKPESLIEKISYFFYGDNAISNSVDIISTIDDEHAFLSENSKVNVGNLLISVSEYSLYSFAIKETILSMIILIMSLFFLNFYIYIYRKKDKSTISYISSVISGKGRKTDILKRLGDKKYLPLIESFNKNSDKYERKIQTIKEKSLQESISLKKEIEAINSNLHQVLQVKEQYLSLFNSISNDIKNPLQTISVFISQIEKANLSEEQLNQCRIIQNASDEILSLSDKITNDYLISDKNNKDTNKNIDLIDSLGIKSSSFQKRAEKRGISVYFEVSEGIDNYLYLNWQAIVSITNNIVGCMIDASLECTIKICAKTTENLITLTFSCNNFIEDISVLKENKSTGEIKNTTDLNISLIKTNTDTIGGSISIDKNDKEVVFTLTAPVKNKGHESPAQSKKKTIIKKSGIKVSFESKSGIFYNSYSSILKAFAIDIISIEDLTPEDKEKTILIGENLSENLELNKISEGFYHVASLETKIHQEKLNGINTVFSLSNHPYQIIEKLIGINETRSMPKIGANLTSILDNQKSSTNPLAMMLASKSSKGPLDGYKILLVDNHTGCLESTKIILEELDAIVSTAVSAEEGIELIENKIFDVVATDYSFKNGVEGIEVAKAAKDSRMNKDCHFICHTSDIDIKTNKNSNSYFGSIITKPSNNKNVWIKTISSIPKRKPHMTLL